MIELFENKEYKELFEKISTNYVKAKSRAFKAINNELTLFNWETGKYIVEFEQKGYIKAKYGKKLLDKLSKDLTEKHHTGFSRSNVVYMRLFYLKYPKGVTVSHLLSWSHYYELLKIKNDTERSFYEQQSIIENWSVRELRRQKKTGLFQRIALSKNKDEILELAKKGYKPKNENDLIKEPYVFEFLGLPHNSILTETDNETIGIILASEKDDIFVEYATASITNKLAIGEYQLYLPDKELLKEKVKEILEK